MRVLWVSNAAWANTGYGVQGKNLLPHLISMGHDLAIFAFYGLEGGKVDLPLGGSEGPVVTHYPRFQDPYGNDAVAAHARDFEADVVLSLLDVWVCDPRIWSPLNWIAWLPIDHDPIPEPVMARLPHMRHIVPYSRFGERLVQQTGLPCTYIPHGVDTEVYRPFPELGRRRAKEALGFNDSDYIVGMVGANKGFPSRKAFPEAFQAFAKLRELVPQARLYVHSQIGGAYGGPNLQHLAELCGISAYVRFVDQYALSLGLPPAAMAVTYNAMDVLLQSSTHEGFGLPMLEAQACGTPVVATDSTSMRELVAPACGALVGSLQPQLSTLMSWVAVPDVRGMAKALQRLYLQPPGELERSLLRSWSLAFDWGTIADHYWRPLLDQVAEQLGAATSADAPLKVALEHAVINESPQPSVSEHRHEPPGEPCCPECCNCSTATSDEEIEGDRHGCCCEHVVDELQSMPAPHSEVLAKARQKFQDCPHQEVMTELELALEDLRAAEEAEA